MGNRFSANFRSRAQAGQIPAAVLEFTVSGTTYRFSDQPVASLSQGMFKPQVLDWGGSLVEAADDRNSSVEASALSVTIADHDDALSNLFFGVNRRAVFNSTAKVYLAYSDIAFADWFTCFTGRIATKDLIEPKVWRIGLRFDDSALAADTADFLLPAVDEKTHPTAPDDSLGKEIPLIYGKREWDGTNQRGDIEAFYCSTDGDLALANKPHRYVVCLGHICRIVDIYADSTISSPILNQDYFKTERNGIYFTEVGFDSPQTTNDPPVGTITESFLITNPAKQIEHFLLNFVYNRWRGGSGENYYTTGKLGVAPIDSTSVTTLETFFDDRGVIGSVVLRSGAVLQILNSWLEQNFCAAWWNEEGKLQFGVRSPYDSDIYDPDSRAGRSPSVSSYRRRQPYCRTN
ncbi:MAG: hypothetical protein ACYTEW_27360 [Planctomycetota bacterium]